MCCHALDRIAKGSLAQKALAAKLATLAKEPDTLHARLALILVAACGAEKDPSTTPLEGQGPPAKRARTSPGGGEGESVLSRLIEAECGPAAAAGRPLWPLAVCLAAHPAQGMSALLEAAAADSGSSAGVRELVGWAAGHLGEALGEVLSRWAEESLGLERSRLVAKLVATHPAVMEYASEGVMKVRPTPLCVCHRQRAI